MARKAWDYVLSVTGGEEPLDLWYSRDHYDGPRWVARMDNKNMVANGLTPCGYVNSSRHIEVTTEELRQPNTKMRGGE